MDFPHFLGAISAVCFCGIMGALVGGLAVGGFGAAILLPKDSSDDTVIGGLALVGVCAGAAGGIWLCAARFI